MKQLKRWLGCLLVLCMVASIIPFTAHAETITGTHGDNGTWTLSADGTLTVSGDGPIYECRTNGAPWREYRDSILSVVIEDGITTIGECAFASCTNLSSVSIPNSVTSIDDNAFDGCTSLTSIEIPDSVTTIRLQAFINCSSLTSVSISQYVTSIASLAFAYCESLTGIYVHADNPAYSNDTFGCLYTKEKTVLMQAPGAISGEFTVPKGVTTIESSAFASCKKLTSVIIPNSVTSIGMLTFQACSNLAKVKFTGSAPTFNEIAFNVTTCSIYYPANDPSWTTDVMQDYGGTITWVPYDPAETPDDPEPPVETLTDVVRISGSGRTQTALATADALKEKLGVETFDTIVLSSGKDFADALAGSYLANAKNAPILLYQNKNSTQENVAYIQENLTKGGKVYILGGTAAVPESVESALSRAGISAERLQGSNRFDTNMKILEAAGVANQEILICTGWNYADCLSASAAGLPILMVNSTKNKLTDDQISFLTKYKNNTFTIIGGTSAVSNKLENDISEIVGSVNRIYGSSREETSVAVANRYFPSSNYAFIAYSRNFPDGLCGGPVAYAYNAPLLLVNKNQEKYAADYITKNNITKGCVLGGSSAVSDEIVKAVFVLSE